MIKLRRNNTECQEGAERTLLQCSKVHEEEHGCLEGTRSYMKEQRVEPFEAEELQAQERHRMCAHRLCKECKR
jgi:hypothetical protein